VSVLEGTLKLLLVYGLKSSRTISRLLCLASRLLDVDALLLLGDTVSPSIVEWLTMVCGVRVLGLLGRLDDAAIPQYLRRINGLLDGRVLELKGYRLLGIGVTPVFPKDLAIGKGVDIVATYRPSSRECCGIHSDIVAGIVDTLKPRLVVAGSCSEPCVLDALISPGDVWRGYIGYIEVNHASYSVRVLKLDELVQVFKYKYMPQS